MTLQEERAWTYMNPTTKQHVVQTMNPCQTNENAVIAASGEHFDGEDEIEIGRSSNTTSNEINTNINSP